MYAPCPSGSSRLASPTKVSEPAHSSIFTGLARAGEILPEARVLVFIRGARDVPIDRLMAETDAPNQAPHPRRGTRSEPAYVAQIIEAMARARSEPMPAFAQQLTENTRRFFEWNWAEVSW